MNEAPRKKRRLLKIVGWAVVGFVGLIAMVIVALLLIIDEQYKEWVTAAAGSATGRELMIDGGFNVHIGQQVGISAKGIRFANAEWGTRADMITADRLDLRVNLVPLLKGTLDFTLELEGADILLETNEDGRNNWVFGSSGLLPEKESKVETEDASGSFFLPIKFYSRSFEFRELAFAYINKSGGQDIQVDVEKLSVNMDGAEVSLSLLAVYGGAPVELQGSLGRIDDWYSNNATPVSLTGLLNEALLEVEGSVGPFFPQRIAEFDLSLKAPTISTFNPFVGSELPDFGALHLDAKLKSSAKTLELEVANATLKSEGMEAKATVTVADLMTFNDVNGTIDAELGSLSNLALITNMELPKTGPWTLNVRVSMEKGFEGPSTLSAGIDGERIKAAVEATVPDIRDADTFTAKLSIDTDSLTRFGGLLNRKLPDAGPLKVTGSASAKPGEYRFDELLILLDKGEIRGDLAYITLQEGDSGRPKISGQMRIQDLDISQFFAANEDDVKSATEQHDSVDEASEATVEAEKPGGRKLFSSEPFSVGALQDYDIDFKLDVANFTIGRRGYSIDGSTAVMLDQGLLKLGPLNFSGTTGGSGKSLIVFDASKPDIKLDIAMDFKAIVPPRYGGTMDLDIDLKGSGESLATLMGSLEGQFITVLEDVELEKSSLTKLGAGLLSQINPLGSDTTLLECAIARFDVTDGIADFTKKFAAQTTEVTWLGSGEINLKTEELDFGIHPEPRKKLSSLTSLGLGELIHIGGTLAEPKIGVDAKDVAKKSFKYSAYIATGGLSFLAEKMVDNQKANKDQCKRILIEMEKN